MEYFNSNFEKLHLRRYVLSKTLVNVPNLQVPTYQFSLQSGSRLFETLLILDTLFTVDFKSNKNADLKSKRIQLTPTSIHPVQWLKHFAVKQGQSNIRARFSRNRHGIRRRTKRRRQTLFLYTQRNKLRHRVWNIAYEGVYEKYNFAENTLRLRTALNVETEVCADNLYAYHTYLFAHFSGLAVYFSIR